MQANLRGAGVVMTFMGSCPVRPSTICAKEDQSLTTLGLGVNEESPPERDSH